MTNKRRLWNAAVRALVYAAAALTVLLLGVYGPGFEASNFIYSQF